MLNEICRALLTRAFEGASPAFFTALVERAHTVRENHAGHVLDRDPKSLVWLFAELGVIRYCESGEPDYYCRPLDSDSAAVGLDPNLVHAWREGAEDQWAGRPFSTRYSAGTPRADWYAAGNAWAATQAGQGFPPVHEDSPVQKLLAVRGALVTWIDEAPDEVLARLEPHPEHVHRLIGS